MVLMKITAWSAKTSLLCKSSKTYDITIILSTCKIKLTCHLYHIVNAYEQKKKFFFCNGHLDRECKNGFHKPDNPL